MSAREGSTRIPRTFKCPHHGSRNLVVCIDGTSNQFGKMNTNIVELYSHITKSDTQLTYYSSGLGALAKVAGSTLGRRLSNALDMAIGRNLHKVIMASYRWLSDNYQDGDRIFLFGFSRGAYQVRALAGMIARVGLLLPGNDGQIPFAFELYSKTDDDDSSLARPASVISQPTKKNSKKKAKYAVLAKTFQKTFCRSKVHIHFVGLWDTVSSVGLGRSRTLPCTTTSCEHICYFRHALALDERRVKFLPEYAYGGRSSHSDDGRVEEVWFAGSHSDVGGGNRYNEKLQSGDIPLLWMRSQAIAAGLEMLPVDVMWKIDDLSKRITDSLNPGWWLLELLPLRRLLYYNSDRHTFRPHFGGPRRILPGQKVHVSVLFKNNYKPCAQFYNNPEGWPAPMFWNDAASHQRLQTLSDLWDKDIFDERSVEWLLDDLKRGLPNLDALDRLAFMASFDICKNTMSNHRNAKRILDTFLNSRVRLVRLSTAVTYCELGWDWPSDTNHGGLVQQITADVSELLNSVEDRRRACTYMPSLCKRTDLKEGLMSKMNLDMLVKLCDNTRVAKDERSSTVAFHSAQALSMMMKVHGDLAEKLITFEKVTDVIGALHSNSTPVLVSVLRVVDGLAKHENGRKSMIAGPTIPTLLKLVRHFDDFVTPAATRALCSLLPDDDLRNMMLRFDVLSDFCDVLDRCSEETKQVACEIWVEFAKHDDIRAVMTQDGCLRKLAKRVLSHVPSKRDGAIMALVALGTNQDQAPRTIAMAAIEAAITIPNLVARLKQKSTALSAASTLAHLVKIDDVAVMVSNDGGVVREGILEMLRRRWFDGLRGEDGLQVLFDLLECDRLRLAVLNAGAIGVLREMIGSESYESVYAGLHYLRVIARFDEEVDVLPGLETLDLVPQIVGALRAPHRRIQRIAMEILRFLSAQDDLRGPIVQRLSDLLNDRRAGVVLSVSTLLEFIATHRSLREKVVLEESFLRLSHDYYDGWLKLEYEKGRGPSTGEVYESIGRMIRKMQVDEGDGTEVIGTEDRETEEKRWPARVPYELTKKNRAGVYWIATLLCFPPLLLSGVGQRVYRELWQEG